MHRIARVSAAVLLTLGFGAISAAGLVVAAESPAQPSKSASGPVLTGGKGMTLYVFDKDSAGRSACDGTCATNWRPLMAPTSARSHGDYSVVTRDDGSKQWAYKGRPLYHWKGDAKPGDTTGDGVNQVWHVARP